MNTPKSWIILLQTHAYWNRRPSREEILSALGVDALIHEPQHLHDPHHDVSIATINWREAQIQQAEWVARHQASLEQVGEHVGLAYFGVSFIPLVLDLGFRLRTWHRARVFQQHHLDAASPGDSGPLAWRWRGRSNAETPPQDEVSGLPEAVVRQAGEVVVRVSASYNIQPEHTRGVVPQALAEIDLRVRPTRTDPYQTPEELEATVVTFANLLKQIHERLPLCTRIHLFVAGPTGLCFRLGGSINPTIYPRIQAWQFDRDHPLFYRPALIVGQPLSELQMKIKILFMTSDPLRPLDPANRIHPDRDAREIGKRLDSSKHRDRFEIQHQLAVIGHDLLGIMARSNAAIIHFSGHGNNRGQLAVERPGGSLDELRPDGLAQALKVLNEDGHIKLVVLSACHSAVIAEGIAQTAKIPCVIGMNAPIGDDAAIIYAAELYGALAEGNSVGRATRLARAQLELVPTHRKSAHIVEVHSCASVDLDTVFLVRA